MAKPRWNAEKLLAHVLEGKEFTTEMLDDVLHQRVREGQFLDFKHGRALKVADPAHMIREYVAGFANADGGLLVIGVDDPEGEEVPRTVTGCEPMADTLDEWASRALSPLLGYVTPAPRFQVIEHAAGLVLVIGVARAPNLIPVFHGRRVHYYLRMGDQTMSAPESVQTDLLLGRRVRPQLALSAPLVTYKRNMNEDAGRVEATLFIENIGLLWCPELLIYWIAYFAPSEHYSRPAPALMRYIDVRSNQRFPRAELGLQISRLQGPIDPLSNRTGTHLSGTAYVEHSSPMRWQSVVLVIPRDSPPTVLQLDYRLSGRWQDSPQGSVQLPPGQLGVVAVEPFI